MAVNCQACADLRENSTEFITNGVTDSVCASLKNDTGFNPSADPVHNDCYDLDAANDCLIGNMEDELEAYEVCDWKSFMRRFITNTHAVIKSIICALCGIWTNIHRLSCYVDFLLNPKKLVIGENTSGNAYCVAGKGTSFLISSGGEAHTTDVSLTNYGSMLRFSGSLDFYTASFTDKANCLNFDSVDANYNPTLSKNRIANSSWGEDDLFQNYGELALEMRIKNSAYPWINKIVSGQALDTGGGAYHAWLRVFNAGSWAFGQTGSCNENTGAPDAVGYSHGHLVPNGWTYIQVRVKWTVHTPMGDTSGKQRTPAGYLFLDTKDSGIECE